MNTFTPHQEPVGIPFPNLDPLPNNCPAPSASLAPDFVATPNFDFGIDLESQGGCQGSVLDFGQFMDDTVMNTMSGTPEMSFNTPGSLSDAVFSATTPSTSSLATSVESSTDMARKGSGYSEAGGNWQYPQSTLSNVSNSPPVSPRQHESFDEQQQGYPGEAIIAPEATMVAPSINLSDWVSKVAEINVSLLNHCEQNPSMEEVPASPQSYEPLAQEKDFAIDQTFLLSQRFIDLLNQAFPRFSDGSGCTQATSASSPPLPNYPPGHSNYMGSSTASKVSSPTSLVLLDPGSIFLVLSCHLRLLETYDKIFSHIESWVKERSAQSSPPFDLRLPGLVIGAFSLQSSSSLQATLLIQLAEQLLSRLREITLTMDASTAATTAVGPRRSFTDQAPSTTSFTPLNDVADGALQAVKAREVDTLETIARVKRLLEPSGVV